ncbi:MAG TPA: HAMP domain-containing sensor histidine kinase [Solirubrobacteraceae bacterium]|nr:HAMP domain-containing sensor histidine kinase [Solirubrobacteraceae bacterium]
MQTPTTPTNHTRPPSQRPGKPWRAGPITIPPPTAASAAREGQERFAAYVAHELRTPIALQRAVAETALADPQADVTALRAMAEDVVASCKQQQRLIDALLYLTQTQDGPARHEPVDLAAITRRLLQAHDLSRFETLVSLEPAQTTGDPALIERLAANLLSNATRYNVTRGRIELATRTQAERAVLSIANTGHRIPAAELTRLFQPFQRLASQSPASADGVGLGLAIVQAIAEAHDAIIAAQARPDGGLKIDVSFPSQDEGGRARPLRERVSHRRD